MQKKNISDSQPNQDTGVSESENQSSGYAHLSISKENEVKIPFQKPLLQPEHKVKTNEALINTTKNNFLSNPLFDDSNPNAKKNKEIYINHLAESGFDKVKLQKVSEDLTKNKDLLAVSSQKLNANPNDFTAAYDAGNALLGLGKPDDAIAMYNTTLAHLGNQAQQPIQGELSMNTPMVKSGSGALFGIGTALNQKGDYKASIEAYGEALSEADKDEDPNRTKANIYKGLANSAYKLGDKEKSKEYILKANELESVGSAQQKELSSLGAPTTLGEQVGTEAAQEKEQQRQSDEMKGIADGLEDFIKLKPVGRFVGELAEQTALGFTEGGEKFNEGLATFLRGENIATGESGLKATAEGAFKAVLGTAEAAFNLVPQIFAFNAAMKPVNDMAAANPDNKSLQVAADVSSIPFSLYDHLLKWTNREPTKGFGEDFASAVNLLVPVLGHKVGLKGVESLKDLAEKTKQMAEGKLPIEEVQKINLLSDYAKNLKLDDIQLALEKENTPEAKAILSDIKKQKDRDEVVKELQSKREEGLDESIHGVIPDNINSTFERLATDKPIDPTALGEAKDYLFNEYKRLQELKNDPHRMFTLEQIGEAQDRLHSAASEIDQYRSREDIKSPELKELEKQKDDLENADVSSDASKQAVQQSLQDVNSKIEQQQQIDLSDKLEQADLKAELNDIDTKIEDQQKDLEGANPTVAKVIEGNIDGLKAKKQSVESKIKKPKGFDYSKGKTSEELVKEKGVEFSNAEEADRFIAENSENPLEIVNRYLKVDEVKEKSHTDQLLDNANLEILEQDAINDKLPKGWDDKLAEINTDNGTNITREDLVDYIRRKAIKETSVKETPIKSKFKQRFKELTGQELTPSNAKRIVELELKKYKLYERDFEYREGLNAAELEQYYYEGIKEGRIKPFDNEHFSDVSSDKASGKGKVESKNLSVDDRIAELKRKRAEGKKPGEAGYAASGFAKLLVDDLPYYTELGALYIEKYADLFKENVSEFYNKFREENPELKDASDKDLEPLFGGLNKKEGDFEKLTSSSIPNSGEVGKYLSGETIEKYEGEEASNNQEIVKMQLAPALEHGVAIVESAKEKFGDNYVSEMLSFIENSKNKVEEKALMYVSLENDLASRKLSEPHNELEIQKQQDLVREKSQAFARSASLAINMGRLRKFAEVGYDIGKVTEGFFSSKELEGKKKVEKALQSNADEINKEAHNIEEGKDSDTAVVNKERANKIREGNKKRVGKKYDAPFESAKRDMVAEKVAKGLEDGNSIERTISDLVDKGEIKEENKQAAIDYFKEIDAPKTMAERLVSAKDRIRERINKIREEIIAKKRELKERGSELHPDIELSRLQAEEKAIASLRDKYLPKEGDPYLAEKAIKTITDKILSEIEKINKQIGEGERAERANKKDPYKSEEITKLKAEKKVRLDLLESIDPAPKEFVKKALIENGFGREITVKTKNGKEKKQIVDWKKLAGEEGSIDKIQRNVEQALKDKGYSEAEILRVQDAFVEEYKALRASVVEKSINELDRGNTEKQPVDTKSIAKRISELYDYGLFEKEADTYDYLMNKALGLSGIGQESFFKAKELANSLSKLYKSGVDGRNISEFGLKPAINIINDKIGKLISDSAWRDSNSFFKVAQSIKELMGLVQRGMLTSVKQLLENPFTGYIQRGYGRLGFSLDKIDNKALRKNRSEIAKMIYEDNVRHGGLIYGDVSTPLLSKTKTEGWLNKQSDSQVYHTIISGMLGKSYLDAADSMHKAALTEKYFAFNLIKVLHEKGMTKEDAVNYASEQLTGQKFSDALVTAKEIIDKVNKEKGSKVLPDNKEAIHRLAQNIVKDALVEGKKLSLREIESSYKAAYKAAGYDLGHEANNPISLSTSLLSSKIETDLNKAIKEKEWNKAAAISFLSILNRNIINPFVGGGTNWTVLSLQKAGLDPISPLYNYAMKGKNKLDVTTEHGIKNLENSLTQSLKSKNTNIRMVAGAMGALLTYYAAKATDSDETINEWLKKNQWAKKYFSVVSPPVLLMMLAHENKKVADYFAQILNMKYDTFDDTKRVYKMIKYSESDKKADKGKAVGKLGELIGGKVSTPVVPWRFAKDIQGIYRGVKGKDPIKVDYQSQGFFNGLFMGGLIDYAGLRPDKKDNKLKIKE